MGFGSMSEPPVKEGDEIDVMIEAVGGKGDGIAKKDGFVIFVPNTRAGDNVRIKVTRVLKNVGFGEKLGESSKAVVNDNNRSSEPKPVEEEFDPQEELDSEDFGDE